jgi:hypothetical protein
MLWDSWAEEEKKSTVTRWRSSKVRTHQSMKPHKDYVFNDKKKIFPMKENIYQMSYHMHGGFWAGKITTATKTESETGKRFF